MYTSKRENPANYNNEIFISECINSIRKQTYINIEITFFDNHYKDKSIHEIKNFKEVKIIQNKIKTKIGSFNQMKAFEETYNTCASLYDINEEYLNEFYED